jgi:flagellar FliJ protein
MPFNFKLQKVLDLKKQLEEETKLKLAQLIKEYLHQEFVLKKLQKEKETILQNLKTLLIADSTESAEFIQIDDILATYQYIEGINLDINLQQEKLKRINKEIDKIRDKLITISKEKRLFERLKEKYRMEYLVSLLKKEADFLDELGIIMHQREEKLLVYNP